MTDERLTKADRLAIGGAVAPVVRRQAAAPRRVTLVGKDGKPTGQTTSVEVAKSLLARAEIEFSVHEGKRPEWVKCEKCGAPVKVGKSGRVRRECRPKTYRCECGRPVTPKSGGCGFGKSCARCTGAKKLRSIPLEERRRTARSTARKAALASAAKRTKEEMRARLKRNQEAMTHEDRSRRSKQAAASRTPEARSAAIKKQWANVTPEQRAARGAKISATATAKRAAKVSA